MKEPLHDSERLLCQVLCTMAGTIVVGVAGKRILTAASNMRPGNIENDKARLRIPFAALLPASFLLYLFVSFRK